MSVALARADVLRFRDFVTRKLGLQFEDGKLDELASVLRERMELLGLTLFGAYENQLRAREREELGVLAQRLTVGETYFFRYWDQFRAFVEVVLPASLRARSGRPVRVLSAGCASGEEAYSLAILARESAATAGARDVRVLGLDVNRAALEKAARARYSTWSLRETSPERRTRYFRPDGRDFCLASEVVTMASFEERNLVDEDASFWRPDAFDVVFCRNVLMYFNPDVMAAVVARITRSLAPEGFLFLGHAETLRGVSQDFHLRHTHETFYYQRRGAPEIARSPWPRLEPSIPDSPPLGDSSWVDAIQRASERVAQLTRAPQPPVRGTAEAPSVRPGPASFDLQPAVELLRQERHTEAMDLLHAMPESSRVDPDAQLLRAALLTNSGMLAEAEATCEEILRKDELSAGAHYLMALCREHAGDRRAALDHDQAAIYLDAEFAMPHLHAGLLARRSHDREEARAELGRALTLLAREDAARILLFGGGFTREALIALCRSELRASESTS
jgi:chemotaxis protein methyltransferase CheR